MHRTNQSGWVRTYAEAREMISLGVKRIGTGQRQRERNKCRIRILKLQLKVC
jgi:deoxyribose-phosphate aldolase